MDQKNDIFADFQYFYTDVGWVGGSEKVQKFADVIQGWSPICGLLASKESQVLVQHSVHCLQLPFCPHNVVSLRAVGMSEILGGVGGVYLYRGKHLSSMVPGGQKSWGTMALSPSLPCLTVTKSQK